MDRSFFISPKIIQDAKWLTFCPNLLQISNLCLQIFKSDARGTVTLPSVGELYGSEYESCWYRAEVVHVEPKDGKVHVLYVDFGNTEVVSIDQLRHLPDSVLNLPRQVRDCYKSCDDTHRIGMSLMFGCL